MKPSVPHTLRSPRVQAMELVAQKADLEVKRARRVLAACPPRARRVLAACSPGSSVATGSCRAQGRVAAADESTEYYRLKCGELATEAAEQRR